MFASPLDDIRPENLVYLHSNVELLAYLIYVNRSTVKDSWKK